MQLLEEAKNDFNLFKNNSDKYQDKVNKISKLFNLKNEFQLRNDFLPTYFAGNYDDGNEKYVLFGLNPGFKEKINLIEESHKNKSWETYIHFLKNFYNIYPTFGKSPYYKRLSHFFFGLDKSNSEPYKFYNKSLVVLESIPYHSSRFSLPSLKEEQINYLTNRFKVNLEFIEKFKVKALLFNGKKFEYLLDLNIIKPDTETNIKIIKIKNTNLKIIYFNINGIPCVIFNHFLTAIRGAYNSDLYELGKIVSKLID